MYVKEVTVENQVGLHARPATSLFRSQRVQVFHLVEKEERRVNAKSLLASCLWASWAAPPSASC